jgi:2-polyprenyl-6-methoxyphenol hydroxylase-like FAD-dependent oxidoreductase
MEIAIIGGGIVGLSLALNLHQSGIACRIASYSIADLTQPGAGTAG